MFVHDSLHSTRNVRWELETAWRALAPGGLVIVDDVDCNWGFERFREGGAGREPLWCMADDGQRVFSIVRKPGAGAGRRRGPSAVRQAPRSGEDGCQRASRLLRGTSTRNSALRAKAWRRLAAEVT